MRRTGWLLALAASLLGDPLQRAPRSATVKMNPYAGQRDAWLAGKKLFEQNCAACHGSRGEGHGKALPLNSAYVRNAPPGAVFYVLTNGSLRRGMPSFDALPEPERWQIITYLQGRPKACSTSDREQ